MFTNPKARLTGVFLQPVRALRAAVVAVAALALVACGGGGGGNGGGSSFAPAPTPVTPAPVAASLVVTSSLATLPSDGSLSADIKVLVRDTTNVVMSGVAVTLQSSSGALSSGKLTTDSAGEAIAKLGIAGDPTARTITVTVKAGTLTSTVNVAVGVPATTSLVNAVTLVTSATSIPADGSSTATIAAIVRDANNLLMVGVPVSFAATSGGLAVTQAVTDANGQAFAVLSTAGDSSTRNITVTSTVGTKTASLAVAVAASVPPTTVSMGSGSGASFKPNQLGLQSTSLSVGGSTSVTVTLVQSDGTLYTKPATINFNSPCVAAGTAAIQPAASASTTTGQLSVTYVAKGCAGSDQISATAAVGSQNLLATGTVTVAQAAVGSIAFVSATPTNVALKGTGEAGRPEVSTVVFRVLDVSGGPRAGATVNFTLSSTVGGLSLTSPTATSDVQGNVQATVNAGTVATTVRVNAVVADASGISTQSSQLTVSTGIPTAGSFSIAAVCANVEGWDFDGTIAPITVRLSDRFSNPVPNGTAVSFMAEAGAIQPQCTTTSTATEGGLCTVNWRSSQPRMPDGRVSLLATAIGEESFIDTDGDGKFNVSTDTFRLTAAGGLPAHDLGEPWLDVDESASYNPGEPFYDYFANNFRDPPDGLFNGRQCLNGCSAGSSAPIGAQYVLVMSGSTAQISFHDAATDAQATSFTVPVKGSKTFYVWVRDGRGNVMPGGTTVTATASGSGVTLAEPATYGVLCGAPAANSTSAAQSIPGFTRFSFTVLGTAAGSALVNVSVKTPKGTESIAQLSITVP